MSLYKSFILPNPFPTTGHKVEVVGMNIGPRGHNSCRISADLDNDFL